MGESERGRERANKRERKENKSREREREWMYVQGAKNCACNDSNCFFTCHLAKMLAQNLPRHGASIFFSHTPLTKPKLQSADADM